MAISAAHSRLCCGSTSNSRPNWRNSTPLWASTAWRAAATPSIRAFWVDAFPDAKRLENALIGFFLVILRVCGRRLFHRWATGDGRTGQPGVVERLVRSGSEPDVAADLGVDDGIARDDLAFAGRAVADHPIATLRESAGSGRDNHRAGQQQ